MSRISHKLGSWKVGILQGLGQENVGTTDLHRYVLRSDAYRRDVTELQDHCYLLLLVPPSGNSTYIIAQDFILPSLLKEGTNKWGALKIRMD